MSHTRQRHTVQQIDSYRTRSFEITLESFSFATTGYDTLFVSLATIALEASVSLFFENTGTSIRIPGLGPPGQRMRIFSLLNRFLCVFVCVLCVCRVCCCVCDSCLYIRVVCDMYNLCVVCVYVCVCVCVLCV